MFATTLATFASVVYMRMRCGNDDNGDDDDDDEFIKRLRERMRSSSSTTRRRPFVTLTFAQSVDGNLALRKGQPTRLSGQESMVMTHRLRAFHDGILVGVGTVIADNPSLTTRLVPGSNPKPIVLDSRLRIPLDSKLLNSDKCERPIIITSKTSNTKTARLIQDKGATVLYCNVEKSSGHICLSAAMELLKSSLKINSLMVEGGASVLSSFLSSRLGDELIVTVAPCFLMGGLSYGNNVTPSPASRLDLHSVITRSVGHGDVLIAGSLSK